MLKKLPLLAIIFAFILTTLSPHIELKAQTTPTEPNPMCIILLSKSFEEKYELLKKFKLLITENFSNEVIPVELGKIRLAEDIRVNSGFFALGTDRGFIATRRPVSETHRLDPNSLNMQGITLNMSYGAPAEVQQIIPLSPQKRQGTQLVVRTRNIVRLIKGAQTFDFPYSANAKSAQLTHEDHLFVSFEDRIRMYNTERISMTKEFKPENQFKAAAIKPTDKDIVIAVDGDRLVEIKNFSQKKDLGVVQGHVEEISWNHTATHYYIKSGSLITIYNAQTHTPTHKLDLEGHVYSLKWEHVGLALAASSPSKTILYNLNTNKEMEIPTETTGGQELHYGLDGLMMTVGRSTRDNKEIWLLEVWDTDSGNKLPLELEVNLLHENERPPKIVGAVGSLIDGTFKFMLLREDGKLLSVNQIIGDLN